MNQSDIFQKKKKQEKVFSVSEFVDLINQQISSQTLIVRGEIGGDINVYPRFAFFDLLDKDREAKINCFSWKNKIKKLGVELEEGMEVKVKGHPELRKKRGDFNFQVEKISLVGEGDLKKQFEALKKKLKKEGLFSADKKEAIPRFPEKIGLITSEYGKGARGDFIEHLGDFGFEVYFYDVRVEGTHAVEELKEAIKWFDQKAPQINTLILTRGGGSWESLQAFNDEEIARAIFGSKIPTLVGIGHENDKTIAGFVADKRASTPTDVAKILRKNWERARDEVPKYEKTFSVAVKRIFSNVEERLEKMSTILTESKDNWLKRIKENLKHQEEKIGLSSPVSDMKEKFHDLADSLEKDRKDWLEKIKELIEHQKEKLKLSNPEFKLKQGYSITTDKDGEVIKKAKDVNKGEEVTTQVNKGHIKSKVKKTKNE